MKKQEFAVIVLRGKRKTLSLSVNEKGDAVVRAPNSARTDEIQQFVSRHSEWIARRRKEIERSRPDFSDGASVEICGRRYTIVPSGRAGISGQTLRLPEQGRETALIGLLKRMVRERMCRIISEYAARYGFLYTSIQISSARGRWGSCSTSGTLSFSFRTAFLTDEEARYIAVHELCHTRHMNHGPAFWKEVRDIFPDYLAVRKGLRSKSSLMLFL